MCPETSQIEMSLDTHSKIKAKNRNILTPQLKVSMGLGTEIISHLCVLLQQHLVQDGHQPVFKFTVVIIGH